MAVPFAWTEDVTPILLETHASRHQNGGADEVSVTGLSGLLADDQHVLDAEVVAVAVAKTTFNAKGDLLTASADDTPAIHTVGSNGEFLVPNSTNSNGLEWVSIVCNNNTVVCNNNEVVYN